MSRYRRLATCAAVVDVVGWTISVVVVTGHRYWLALVVISAAFRVTFDVLSVNHRWAMVLMTIVRTGGLATLAWGSAHEHPIRAVPAALIGAALAVGLVALAAPTRPHERSSA